MRSIKHVIGVGLLTILSATGGFGESPAQNQPSWRQCKILFVCLRDKNFDLCTVNPDGSDRTDLTNHPADDRKARWSPDGSKILFESSRGGRPGVFIMNADGSQQTRLASGMSPVFSEDGTKIHFYRGTPEHTRLYRQSRRWRTSGTTLYTMNVDGTDLKEDETIRGDYLLFSPDKSRVAEWAHVHEKIRIREPLPTDYGGTYMEDRPDAGDVPHWASDGVRLVYSRRKRPPKDSFGLFGLFSGGNVEIYLKSDGKKREKNLTRHRSEDLSPRWSPDGEKIVFRSYRSGVSDIFIMSANGRNVKRLTHGGAHHYSPRWSPLPKASSHPPMPDKDG